MYIFQNNHHLKTDAKIRSHIHKKTVDSQKVVSTDKNEMKTKPINN